MTKQEIENIIGIEAMNAPCVSAKTGLNMEQVLDEISSSVKSISFS